MYYVTTTAQAAALCLQVRSGGPEWAWADTPRWLGRVTDAIAAIDNEAGDGARSLIITSFKDHLQQHGYENHVTELKKFADCMEPLVEALDKVCKRVLGLKHEADKHE